MEPAVIEAVSLGGQAAIDLSVWTLFIRADIIVKLVMIALLLASLWSWTIIFEKYRRLRRVDKEAESFEDAFWAGGALEDLYSRIGARPNDPMESLFASAMGEWHRSTEKGLVTGSSSKAALQSRIERVMQTMPLQKVATVDDVASLTTFFSSDALAGHLTGTIAPVAGGMEGRIVAPQ